MRLDAGQCFECTALGGHGLKDMAWGSPGMRKGVACLSEGHPRASGQALARARAISSSVLVLRSALTFCSEGRSPMRLR